MAEQNYTLDFKGYWREENWGSLPAVAGVYCVYACIHDETSGTVSLQRLLYIGESGNVRRRVPEDPEERLDEWEDELDDDEVLCVSYAKIKPQAARRRAEAAMINHHMPPCNCEYVFDFRFDKTHVKTKGKNAKLTAKFTVERH